MTVQPRAHDISVEAIEHMLASRIEVLARELLPDGEQRGHEWVARNPGRADMKLGSLSVNLHSGKWADFASDQRAWSKSPCLSLVAAFACQGRYVSEGPGRPGAIRWARDWLGLSDRNASPARARAIEEEAAKAKDKRIKDLQKDAEKKRAAAHAMWLNAKALDGHDPASCYLAARGIDIHALAEIPGCLRFAPDVRRYHGNDDYTVHPALLAAMNREGAPGGFAAVHRTYLAFENGRWWKAFGPESKTILGPKSGSSIRLTKGVHATPLARALPGEAIAIAEGIENALSAALAMPDLRVLAAGSLENIAKVQLPEHIKTVQIIADNDRPDSEAAKALTRALDALATRGLDVEELRAPDGFKDFNAVLMGERSGVSDVRQQESEARA